MKRSIESGFYRGRGNNYEIVFSFKNLCVCRWGWGTIWCPCVTWHWRWKPVGGRTQTTSPWWSPAWPSATGTAPWWGARIWPVAWPCDSPPIPGHIASCPSTRTTRTQDSGKDSGYIPVRGTSNCCSNVWRETVAWGQRPSATVSQDFSQYQETTDCLFSKKPWNKVLLPKLP